MAFIKESPISQQILDRFEWEKIPLLYQGEAGIYADPVDAVIDYERDLIFTLAGGGGGRTSGVLQPFTYVYFYKGYLLKLVIKDTGRKHELDPKTNIVAVWTYVEWTILRLCVPEILENNINEIVSTLKDAIATYKKDIFTEEKEVVVKLAHNAVEYV